MWAASREADLTQDYEIAQAAVAFVIEENEEIPDLIVILTAVLKEVHKVGITDNMKDDEVVKMPFSLNFSIRY